MQLDLNDQQTDALARLLSKTIDGDRYPLSPRIQVLKETLSMIRPEQSRKPLPLAKQYEPPRFIRGRRRRV